MEATSTTTDLDTTGDEPVLQPTALRTPWHGQVRGPFLAGVIGGTVHIWRKVSPTPGRAS